MSPADELIEDLLCSFELSHMEFGSFSQRITMQVVTLPSLKRLIRKKALATWLVMVICWRTQPVNDSDMNFPRGADIHMLRLLHINSEHSLYNTFIFLGETERLLIAVSALCSASKERVTEVAVAFLISRRHSNSTVTESSVPCSHSPARIAVLWASLCRAVCTDYCVSTEIVRRTSIFLAFFLLKKPQNGSYGNKQSGRDKSSPLRVFASTTDPP